MKKKKLASSKIIAPYIVLGLRPSCGYDREAALGK